MNSAISAIDQHHRDRQSSCFAILFLFTFVLAMLVRQIHFRGGISYYEFLGLLGVAVLFFGFNCWAICRIYPVHQGNQSGHSARTESLMFMEKRDRRLVIQLFRWANIWFFALAICVHYCFSKTQTWVVWAIVPYTAILAYKWIGVDAERWKLRSKWTKIELENLVCKVVYESGYHLPTWQKGKLVNLTFEEPEFQKPSLKNEINARILSSCNILDWPYCLFQGIYKWYHQKYALKTEDELRSALMAQIRKSRHE